MGIGYTLSFFGQGNVVNANCCFCHCLHFVMTINRKFGVQTGSTLMRLCEALSGKLWACKTTTKQQTNSQHRTQRKRRIGTLLSFDNKQACFLFFIITILCRKALCLRPCMWKLIFWVVISAMLWKDNPPLFEERKRRRTPAHTHAPDERLLCWED